MAPPSRWPQGSWAPYIDHRPKCKHPHSQGRGGVALDDVILEVTETVTKQGPMGISQSRPLSPAMSSTCLLSAGKLQSKNTSNQRSEKMQKERKTVKQDKLIIL